MVFEETLLQVGVAGSWIIYMIHKERVFHKQLGKIIENNTKVVAVNTEILKSVKKYHDF